ncbi:MAG: metal ABC transporter permease [Candidatus Hecatellaceae archaeon]|nr:MAG: metal ABC transporter permease [Candidatus Hecatellales archaeon]
MIGEIPTLVFRSAAGAVLIGLLAGLISVFIIRIKLSSMGFCMSHAAFAGAALGVGLSMNPFTMALAFSLATASLIGPASDKAKIHPDLITSIAFPLNMALAFIFLTLTPGVVRFTSEVTSILWGSVLSVGFQDLVYLAVLLAASAVMVVLFWKELFAIMFSRRMAEADGINTKPFIYAILFAIGIIVTFSLKLVGGLLVFALLFNPAATALQFSYDIRKVAMVSPLIGAASCLSGLFLSFALNWPAGACIVLASTLGFALSVALSPKRRIGK